MKHTSLRRAALAVGLRPLSAARRAMAQDCTTKIGAVLPTSVDWGKPIAETAQYAVDQVNEAGGVAGCKIEMVLRDSQVDPKVGVDAAKALVDLDGVQLLLGAVSSGVSMPILTSVTVPAGVMQMSCCSSSTAFTVLAQEGKTKGLFFRTFATTRRAGGGRRDGRAGRGLQIRRVLYKNDDWGQDIGKLIAADLASLGITVTGSVAINDAQPSYRAEVTEALKGNPQALYLALYPKEGTAAVREWLSLGGTQNMIVANALKSDEFRDNVGLQYLGRLHRHRHRLAAQRQRRPPLSSSTQPGSTARPNGPGLSNSYDATMIALLAMEAAGKDATGADIAAKVGAVTDPAGTPVTADAAGFAMAKEVLAAGGTVMYQGATGNVRFDANGDVSAPAVTWTFTDAGTVEKQYIPLEEVDAFMASVK